jgi:hypothetical protein
MTKTLGPREGSERLRSQDRTVGLFQIDRLQKNETFQRNLRLNFMSFLKLDFRKLMGSMFLDVVF